MRSSFALCSLLACGIACGDDSGGEPANGSSDGGPSGAGSPAPGSSEPIRADDAQSYFQTLARLLCGGLNACCTDAGHAFALDACMTGLSGLGAQFGGLTYDREAGEACLQNLQNLDGACDGATSMSSAGGPLSIERLCEGVFLGTTPLGEPCEQAAECEPSELGIVACDPLGGLGDELCVVEIRAGEGDPCVETCFEGPGIWSCSYAVAGTDPGTPERGKCFINDGLRCDSATLECVPTLDQGASCNTSEECGAYARCDGTCMPAAGDGEPCGDYSECEEGLLCTEGECGPPSAGLADTCSTFDRLGG